MIEKNEYVQPQNQKKIQLSTPNFKKDPYYKKHEQSLLHEEDYWDLLQIMNYFLQLNLIK